MSDSADKIAGATGIPRAELLAMWADVKANQQRLDGCLRHDFQLIPIPVAELGRPFLGRKYLCANCDGTVDASAAHWYRLGLAHAGGQ